MNTAQGVVLCREGDSEPCHNVQAPQLLVIPQGLLYNLILVNKIIFLNGHRLSLSIIMFIWLHLSALNCILWLGCYYSLRHSENFLSPPLALAIVAGGVVYPPSEYWLSPSSAVLIPFSVWLLLWVGSTWCSLSILSGGLTFLLYSWAQKRLRRTIVPKLWHAPHCLTR